MKYTLLSLLLLLESQFLWAGKALTIPVTITQPDGTRLTVIQYGDEHFHWSETIDGVLLYQEGTAYYIAALSEDSGLGSTGILAHETDSRTSLERAFISRQDKQQMLATAAATTAHNLRRREPVRVNSTFFPHIGAPHVLVVLAEFQDIEFSVSDPKATFEQYLNSEEDVQRNLGNAESNNSGSVKQYFRDMSFGQFEPQFDIVGPVKLPQNLAIYGAGRSDRMDLLMPDVCNAIKDSINFSVYDINNDNYVDLIYVIYAGYPANISGNSTDCIWPKSGFVDVALDNGMHAYRYGVNAELNAYPGAFSSPPYQRVNGIGMFCHEFSHCMGLPDFYPTVVSAQVDNQALEYWSLMDGGENLRNGWAPCAYTAYEREAMGWMTIEELNNDTTITLLPIDQPGGKAFRIRNNNDVNNSEYFIIENIQQHGWNYRNYGHGLLVFHVQYDQSAFSIYPFGDNSVNNIVGKPRMTVIPADGILGSSYNKGKTTSWGTGTGGVVTSNDYNMQHGGDPFPGSSAKNSLKKEDGLVNYEVYTNTKLNWALTDITEQNGAISFRFVRDNSTTSIVTVEDVNNNEHTHVWYTIHGQRLTTPPREKGIYIYNGKKMTTY